MDPRDFEARLRLIVGGGRALHASRFLLLIAAVAAALSLPGLALPSLDDFRAALPELPTGIDDTTQRNRIERAERALAEDPNNGAAYQLRGFARMGLGEYEAALQDFDRQLELGHRPGNAYYNQACAHALDGRPEEAIACLVLAGENGIDVAEFARVDPDLESLHGRPGFEALIGLE